LWVDSRRFWGCVPITTYGGRPGALGWAVARHFRPQHHPFCTEPCFLCFSRLGRVRTRFQVSTNTPRWATCSTNTIDESNTHTGLGCTRLACRGRALGTGARRSQKAACPSPLCFISGPFHPVLKVPTCRVSVGDPSTSLV
jgi:hypothetical protein